MADFSSNVRIPIDVDAQVNGVPSYRPTLARAPDVGGALGAAGEEVERATSTLGKVLATQAQHKVILAAANAEESLKDDFNQIRIDAQRLPGDQQGTYVTAQTSKRAKDFLADPANANITQYMQTRIPIIQGLVVRDAQEHGALMTVKEHQAENDRLDQRVAANDIAGSFTVGPDGRFVDGPQATAARDQVYNRYDALWQNNPVMAAALKRDFDTKVIGERARYIAQHPDASHPTALVDYIEQNRADITPEAEMQLHNMQTSAVNEPMRQREAVWTGNRDAALQYQDDYVAKYGHPDLGRLQSDTEARVTLPEDYQRYAKRQFVEPTPPSTLASFKDAIGAADSEDAIDGLKFAIESSAGSKVMNGSDVAPLNVLLAERLRHLRTTAGSAEILATDSINAHYTPNAQEHMNLGALYPEAFPNARERALAIFRAETVGHPTDPAVYRKAADDAMRAVPRPTLEEEMKELTKPAPAAPISDDDARRVAAHVKAAPPALAK